jgi:hypothetical protein
VAGKLGLILIMGAENFIGSRDEPAAARFVAEHTLDRFSREFPSRPADEFPAWIMGDLGTWNVDFLPYIQDLPMRRRAIMLDTVSPESEFWSQLDS